jgi:hypothetical protein
MRSSSGLLGVCVALSLALLGCSSIAPAAEPSIPRGQCIMSGISRRDDPDIAAQAQKVLESSGIAFSAVVGADRGEASVCNRAGNSVTAFATMDHIVGVTIPVATLSDNEVMGTRVKQVVSELQLSAGPAGPFNLHEVSVHFVVGGDARLVRTSVETAQAAEKQGLSGADYLSVVEVQ